MRRISTADFGMAQGSQVLFSDYEHGGEMWAGEGKRILRQAVTFESPFEMPPYVSVSVSMWDIDCNRNSRADIAAENITTTGFEIVFRTWGDTRVARIRADWMALGALAPEDGWDLY